MPVSTSVHITHCLRYIITLRPQSILDVGCGFGLWGFLCREHLDVAETRVQPHEWRVRIDGVELFEPYIQTHQRALYTKIIIGDIRDLAPTLDNYELIIAGDVIEHLHKDEGERVVEQLYEKATRALMVNIPLGEGWEHPECHGNPGELHRSKWYPEDFYPFPNIYESFTLPVGAYGSFFCPKDAAPDVHVQGLLLAADRHKQEGDSNRALQYAERALRLIPTDRDACAFLADLHIGQGRFSEAIDVLARAIDGDSAFHFAYIALAKLLRALGRHGEAQALLNRLLQCQDVPDSLRADAQNLLRE